MTEDRSWIKVHSGLSDDPQHRERMGVRVWFFMWLAKHADWDTGVVYDYTDKWAGDEMQMSERTVERQRQELSGMGYIIGHRDYQCQHIRIMRWRNPRLVNPTQINIPGDESSYAKLRTHSTQNCVPISTENCVPSTLDSQDSQSFSQDAPPIPNENGSTWIFQLYQEIFGEAVSSGEHDDLQEMSKIYTPVDVRAAMLRTKSANARQRKARKVAYTNGILQEWAVNGKPELVSAGQDAPQGTPIKPKKVYR